MKYLYLIKKAMPIFFAFIFFSCASRKDVVYYQDIDSMSPSQKSNSYEIKIQPDDLLSIIVSAEDAEIAAPFNLNASGVVGASKQGSSGQGASSSYLVDASGTIDFPVLGKIKVSGLSRTEVLDIFQKKISVFIKNPIINLRVLNFKVSVQGEVSSPGSYPVASDRVTLIEAITMAGDLTIFGKRDNILIIREIDGVKSYNRVDITKSDFMNSPFYYLAQNDVVYVEPNKNRVGAAAISPSTGVIISITSILLTIVTLIITITK